MGFGAVAVPDLDDVAGPGIAARDLFVVGEDGVAVLDRFVLGQERSVVRVGLAGGAALPLEVADPEDELGDAGSLGAELDARETGWDAPCAPSISRVASPPRAVSTSRTSASSRFRCSRVT
jgi:hypothetical protein